MDHQVEVVWEAPAECPDLDGVKRYAERLLGQPLAALRGKNISAKGTVFRSELGNWELYLIVAVGAYVEEERLTAKNCRALADAAALKLALACDPLAVVQAVEPAAPPAAVPPADTAAERPSSEARPQPRRLGLRSMIGASFGQLPGISPGAALYASLQLSSFRIELGGQYYWGGKVSYSDLPSIGARLDLTSATARGCLTPRLGRWNFPVCAGFEIGLMRGEGFGVATTTRDTSVWGAVVIGPALRFSLSKYVGLWLEADAVIPVLRPGFHIRNLGTLYVVPQGASRALGGVEVNLDL